MSHVNRTPLSRSKGQGKGRGYSVAATIQATQRVTIIINAVDP